MNNIQKKLTLWIVALCVTLTIAIAPTWAQAPASDTSSTDTTTTKKSPAAAPAKTTSKAAGPASSSDIASAKASGKVWVNTESGVYHSSGRWYGKTKQGKFMTESEAKAAGYKPAKKE
jgi:hypothetical protein